MSTGALASLAITLAIISASLATLMTSLAEVKLRRLRIMDVPNERSSHFTETPRGGGLAIMPIIVVGWISLTAIGLASANAFAIAATAAILTVISAIDDIRGLKIGVRLLAHALATLIGLLALPKDLLLFQGHAPWWADRLLTALAWLWFINLFNFMDGIDGITGVESTTICVGIILVSLVTGVASELVPLAAIVAGVALGFLTRNWHPARIFLGDVGSIPLGFIIGWLLLELAGRGLWLPAIVLSLYYLADATITLLNRLMRGEIIWRAHRNHFYQIAARASIRHDAVVLWILFVDVLLIALALASGTLGLWTLLIGIGVVGSLIVRFSGVMQRAR